MERSILFDLEQNRKRLDYFFQLREKAGSHPSPNLEKWIEIYSERMEKLERDAISLGLKVQHYGEITFSELNAG